MNCYIIERKWLWLAWYRESTCLSSFTQSFCWDHKHKEVWYVSSSTLCNRKSFFRLRSYFFFIYSIHILTSSKNLLFFSCFFHRFLFIFKIITYADISKQKKTKEEAKCTENENTYCEREYRVWVCAHRIDLNVAIKYEFVSFLCGSYCMSGSLPFPYNNVFGRNS